MDLQQICLYAAIISIAISVIQWAVTAMAYKKYSNKGMLVTNNHIVSELATMTFVNGLIYKVFF